MRSFGEALAILWCSFVIALSLILITIVPRICRIEAALSITPANHWYNFECAKDDK